MTERELQAMNDCVRIINNYLASEFEQDCAYSLNDLLSGEIGLMFTNDEFNQDDLQASVDLNAKAINFYRNNKLVKSYDYETYEELEMMINASGLPVSKFFNTSGLLYRNMNLKEELKNCSDEEKIRILSSNGMLIKRPMLVKKNKVLVGYKKDEWEELK